MVYRIQVAGLERDLPLCPISDELYIGAFILFGDVELTEKCAEELAKLAPELATSSWIPQTRKYAFTVGGHDFYF